jgi:hypothetical protein
MTKKLEELFDVETSDDVVDRMLDAEPVEPKPLTVTEIETAMTKVDKIDAALPSVRDLETSDREMDEIAQLAQDTFKDLMDLGMNVEARFSGEIFGNAARMLDTALSAKAHKVNKKLRMVDLQLKKASLDARLAKEQQSSGGEISADGEGIVLDRNTLLQQILNKK